MKSEKHKGTIGGSPAGDTLDDILCEIGDPDLIAKVAKALSMWGQKKSKILQCVSDYELRCEVLRFNKTHFIDHVKNLDLAGFNLSSERCEIIKSLACNVITTGYRQCIQKPSKKGSKNAFSSNNF